MKNNFEVIEFVGLINKKKSITTLEIAYFLVIV